MRKRVGSFFSLWWVVDSLSSQAMLRGGRASVLQPWLTRCPCIL